jgi:hypothetical protein
MLVIGDSDSYVKWGAALATCLPEAWERDLVVLRSPVRPSEHQLASALTGTAFTPDDAIILELDDLAELIAKRRPDVVLAAVRGPVVRVVARAVRRVEGWRPVLATGLPGITIPAARKAVVYRSLTDVVILHSRREIRDFTELAASMSAEQRFALATLPFVPGREPRPVDGDGDIIFAAQAIVPRALDDRMLLLGWLAECARRHPHRRVVIKVRASPGEPQTHTEEYDFGTLVTQLVPPAPDNLVVEGGPMAAHLARAGAVVTVSSTAAIEAVAAGIPALLIDDFGVSPALINTVFEGSGLLASSEDLIAGRFRHADERWVHDNYLHGRGDDDWLQALAELIAARDRGALPWRNPADRVLGGALRHAWDRRRALGDFDRTFSGAVAVAIGTPARWMVRRARRVAARIRGSRVDSTASRSASRREAVRGLP